MVITDDEIFGPVVRPVAIHMMHLGLGWQRTAVGFFSDLHMRECLPVPHIVCGWFRHQAAL